MPKPSGPIGVTALCLWLTVWWQPTLVGATVTHGDSTSASQGEAISAPDVRAPSYVKGRFIVKFKSSLTQCAHCLLAQRRSFQSALTDSSDSLDRLNQQVGVIKARELFVPRHGLTTAQAQEVQRNRLRQLRVHFARRSQRVPPSASLPDLTNVYIFEVPPEADVEAISQRYQHDPHVEYAQPNYLIRVQFVPNDPFYQSSGSWDQPYDDLWGLKKLQLGSAWDLTQGQGTVVAVVDTGLDSTHPDISSNVWVNPGEIPNNGLDDDNNGFVDDVRGWDFTSCAQFSDAGCQVPKASDNDPNDEHGHGTHVSGTIAAVGNNNVGIIGVAPQTQVMPLQGLNSQGAGVTSDLANALVYAAQNGADVINNSWGCSSCPSSPLLEDTVRTAYGLGAVVVFSAGNDGADVSFNSPQNMIDPKPVVVAASTQEDAPAFFTNMGFLVDIAAPGGGETTPPPSFDPFRNILSLKSAVTSSGMDGQGNLVVGQQYVRQAGTSMAAPHVSGVAALILAHHPTFTNEEVRHVLRLSADDINNSGFDWKTGAGRINAARAVAIDSVAQIDTQVTNPGYNTELNPQAGSVPIIGTAAGEDFQQYSLFYSAYAVGAEPTWTLITGPVTTPVVDGTLGTWVVQGLENGPYVLRLATVARNGQAFDTFVPIALDRGAIRITTDPSSQTSPAISNARIVWSDARNGNADIYVYDILTGTEQRLTTDPFTQTDPDISGDRIVWTDTRQGNNEIYLYDLTTNTERRITTDPASQSEPAVSGERIVWTDTRHGNADIYLYDLTTNTERRITSSTAIRGGPRISGTRIVWFDYRNFNWDVYLYDVATNTERRMTTNTSHQVLPAISGNQIVWRDDRNGTLNGDIYLYDLATNTERQLTTNVAFQNTPDISDNQVVWADDRNGNWDVVAYDLVSGRERVVSVNPQRQISPRTWGGYIVWTDWRNGNEDIYMAVPNRKPTLDPLGNKTLTAGKLSVFPVRAQDPDLQLLTLSAPQRPAGSSFFLQGDVMQNGTLEQTDVDRIRACVAKTASCTGAQVKLGDVAGPNGLTPDGTLTSVDADTVQAMLTEHDTPTGDTALLALLNTSLFLWTPTAAQVDADPYTARFQVTDPAGASAETAVGITVTNGSSNLLSNGGFEEGQTDWSGWSTNKQLTTATAYTGTMAAEIILDSSRLRTLSHADVTVSEGTTYRVRAALKTINLGTSRAYVELKWRKAGGGLIRTDTFGYTSGTTDWSRQSSPTYTAPPLAAQLELNLVAEAGAGTAYFDAVRLEQVQ